MVQTLKSLHEKICPMPLFERSQEADDKTAAQVKSLPHRFSIKSVVEEVGIHRVRQYADALGPHAGFLQVPAELFGDDNDEIGAAPDHPFGPLCQ